jgi:hypothetical protein
MLRSGDHRLRSLTQQVPSVRCGVEPFATFACLGAPYFALESHFMPEEKIVDGHKVKVLPPGYALSCLHKYLHRSLKTALYCRTISAMPSYIFTPPLETRSGSLMQAPNDHFFASLSIAVLPSAPRFLIRPCLLTRG